MRSPKISVILPVYNAEKYLKHCLDSIVKQTYRNLELLLIDDGSTDMSFAICAEYARQDKRLKIIHQTNLGTASARNKGLLLAKGKYIHFIDNDDCLLHKNYYAQMLKKALTTNADMTCSEVYYERGKQYLNFTQTKSLVIGRDKISLACWKGYFSVWKYLYKTSFLRKRQFLFDKKAFPADDMLFTMQTAFYANKIAIVPQVHYFYRKTLGSAITYKKKYRDNLLYAWKKLRKFAIINNFSYEFHQTKRFLGIVLISRKTTRDEFVYYLFGVIPVLTMKSYLANI